MATLRPRNHSAVAQGPLACAVRRSFAWGASVRRGRVFHPRGVGFHAEARLQPRAIGLLARQERLEAIVRISRGVGLPDWFPDFNGIAVRLLDAHGASRHQDLLLVSAPMAPVVRHVLFPVPFQGWTGHSSILPYRTPSGLRMLGALPFTSPTTAAGLRSSPPRELTLVGADMLGRWEPEVSLVLGATLDDALTEALELHPWHTGDDFVPAGVLNRLRIPAYDASQAARRRVRAENEAPSTSRDSNGRSRQ